MFGACGERATAGRYYSRCFGRAVGARPVTGPERPGGASAGPWRCSPVIGGTAITVLHHQPGRRAIAVSDSERRGGQLRTPAAERSGTADHDSRRGRKRVDDVGYRHPDGPAVERRGRQLVSELTDQQRRVDRIQRTPNIAGTFVGHRWQLVALGPRTAAPARSNG